MKVNAMSHQISLQLLHSVAIRSEYPALAGGTRLSPEVIAWSTITGGRAQTDVKQLLNPTRFGAIGAYNGHRVNAGRVVVDATWHHFFNINLIGDPGPGVGPIKSQGFHHPSTDPAVYNDIKTYFRNIAVWLAPKKKIACMRWRVLWSLRWYHRIAMDFRPSFLKQGRKNRFV
jgi:hypothetical protein